MNITLESVNQFAGAWLSGGSFGIEGNIVTGLLLNALVILLLRYPIIVSGLWTVNIIGQVYSASLQRRAK